MYDHPYNHRAKGNQTNASLCSILLISRNSYKYNYNAYDLIVWLPSLSVMISKFTMLLGTSQFVTFLLRVRKTQRKKEMEREPLFIGSLLKLQQQLGIGLRLTQAMNPELNPSFPHRWQKPNYINCHCLPGLYQQEDRVQSHIRIRVQPLQYRIQASCSPTHHYFLLDSTLLCRLTIVLYLLTNDHIGSFCFGAITNKVAVANCLQVCMAIFF